MRTFTLVLTSLILFGNQLLAQEMNHFVYKTNVTQSGFSMIKTGYAGEHDFLIDDKIIRIEVTNYNGGKPIPGADSRRLFNLEKNVRIALYRDNTYNIETTDSIYPLSYILEGTGETKTIKGYKCERYNAKTGVVIAGVGFMAAQKKQTNTSYTFWITKDVAGSKQMNRLAISTFTKGNVIADFEGLIVKVDIKFSDGKKEMLCDMTLDKKEQSKIDKAQIEMPWKDANYKPVYLPWEILIP